MPETTPTHGYTEDGTAVHASTKDHYKVETPYQRFNKRIAVGITDRVGTMTGAYCFVLLAFVSLPAVLSAFGPFKHTFPHWMTSVSLIALVAWVAQTFLQLVLLPIIIVGQNVHAEASDARSKMTFENTAMLVNKLDVHTEGGIKDAVDAIIEHIDSKVH